MILGSVPHPRRAKDRVSKLLQSVPGFIPASKFDAELQEDDEEEEEEDPFFLASNKPHVHFNPDDYKDNDDDDSNIGAGAAVAAAKALDIMIPIWNTSLNNSAWKQ